jgi:glycosyltransferase involved in cell wall biosynthesis
MALRVLHVVGGYPTEERPHNQVFLKTQIESLAVAGVHCEVLNLRGRSVGKYVTGWAQVRCELRRAPFDLLHAHYAYCGVACLGHGLPLVLSLLGSDLVGFAGSDGRYSRFSRASHRALSRFVSAQSAVCIVKSRQMQQVLGLDVHVVPNGVDLAQFQPLPPQQRAEVRAALSLAPGTRYVLFAGDPRRPLKRYSLAQGAVALAASRVPFPLELRPLSGQSHGDVIRHMQACDLLLLTSTSEGSPNVVKEAMASGLAVVAVDVGDTRDRLAGVSGCRVTDADDPGTIAAAITDVLTSQEPRAGRQAVTPLRIEAVAARIIAIYEDALR